MTRRIGQLWYFAAVLVVLLAVTIFSLARCGKNTSQAGGQRGPLSGETDVVVSPSCSPITTVTPRPTVTVTATPKPTATVIPDCHEHHVHTHCKLHGKCHKGCR